MPLCLPLRLSPRLPVRICKKRWRSSWRRRNAGDRDASNSQSWRGDYRDGALGALRDGRRWKSYSPLCPEGAFSPSRLLPEGVLTLWSYTDLADPRWRIGTKYLQLRQEKNSASQFKEQMAGIFNPSGWGAYFRSGHLFVKRASVEAGAKYPIMAAILRFIRTGTRSNLRLWAASRFEVGRDGRIHRALVAIQGR